MQDAITRVVIVGGGTAGWLTAGIIAAEHYTSAGPLNDCLPFELTLVESPDIGTIGVGEGTWPSMRSTLQKIGVSETEFLQQCSASFKQGTLFKGWLKGGEDTYTHPFSVPHDYAATNLASHWLTLAERTNFAAAVCPQAGLFAEQLAPKQITTPEYAFNVNYGYHLDAGKFAEFLQRHCVENLGVVHLKTNVTRVNTRENGDISFISTDSLGDIEGDLFVDCSGSRALILSEHYGIPLLSRKEILFNDRALAVQVGYQHENDPIESCTLSTAQSAGWIWEIGLPSRRGIGHVYSSAHISDDQAADELQNYISTAFGKDVAAQASFRKIGFEPGHRTKFWHRNCVAVGMSAGFIEPLEASALVLVELSASMIAEQLPANRTVMDLVSKRFNEKFLFRWDRIVDFLKLHYVLSQREDSEYWRDNRYEKSMPENLADLLGLWRHQSPWHRDGTHVDDMFPSASFQYVLYGMEFSTGAAQTSRRSDIRTSAIADRLYQDVIMERKKLRAALTSNRELLNKISTFGLQKI